MLVSLQGKRDETLSQTQLTEIEKIKMNLFRRDQIRMQSLHLEINATTNTIDCRWNRTRKYQQKQMKCKLNLTEVRAMNHKNYHRDRILWCWRCWDCRTNWRIPATLWLLPKPTSQTWRVKTKSNLEWETRTQWFLNRWFLQSWPNCSQWHRKTVEEDWTNSCIPWFLIQELNLAALRS